MKYVEILMNPNRFLIGTMVVVLGAINILTGFASAEEGDGFQTPTGNIHCAAYSGFLRCDIHQNDAKLPPFPKDCELDWGNAFELTQSNQKPQRVCVGDTVNSLDHPKLPYGKSWSRAGFTCQSAATGLTCKNKKGRGFTLSRQKQILF